MTTSILQGRRRILQYPSRAHETGHKIYILRCTAGIRSREFSSKHTRNLTPSPLTSSSYVRMHLFPEVHRFHREERQEQTGSRAIEKPIIPSISIDAGRENRHRSRGGGHRKKRLAGTTENPSSASAQRLAPDTSTLPTTPQPPSHAS